MNTFPSIGRNKVKHMIINNILLYFFFIKNKVLLYSE